MAGPTAEVLLPAPLSTEAFQRLAAFLSERGWECDEDRDSVRANPSGYPMDWDYRVRGDYGCEIDFEEPESLESFAAQVGWTPEAEIGLMAAVNAPSSHAELGRAAIAVAQLVGGVIDLGGTLDGAEGLPGHRWRIPYGFETGERFEYWVVDVEWLEAWLQQRDFQMVK